MSARFVSSSPSSKTLEDSGLPEISFIGRSNVGKSTLLGRILKRPKLVRTSRTPGRTQLLNLFVLDERLALVDMPGYGYAKLSKTQRAKLDRMVQEYLRDRPQLQGVVQVVDARRDKVSQYDRFVAEWILGNRRALLIAVTKIDKVAKNRRLGHARTIEKQLGAPEGSAVVCSGKTGLGVADLAKRLWELVE